MNEFSPARFSLALLLLLSLSGCRQTASISPSPAPSVFPTPSPVEPKHKSIAHAPQSAKKTSAGLAQRLGGSFPLKGSLQRRQAQVLQKAVDFCKAIGSPVTGSGTATFADKDSLVPMTPTYWQPTWRIRFGQVELQIGDLDGVVCRYYDYGLSQKSMDDRQPAGPAISRTEALNKAAMVIAASHVQGTLAPPEAQETNITSPPQRAGHMWMVVRRRQAQGVAFQDQQVTVILQAETGAIQALGVTFPTPPPTSVKPVLTQAKATAIAQTAITQNEAKGTRYRSVAAGRLTWITPRTHPDMPAINGVMNHAPIRRLASALPPRLAWLCFFQSSDGGSALVPVDVVTGKVIPNGVGFMDSPIRPRQMIHVRPPLTQSIPPPAQVNHDVVATTLPGPTSAPSFVPGVRRYRLSITDIYAPIPILTAMGFDCNAQNIDANAMTDQTIAEKLEQAGHAGSLRLVPGPTAIVPEGGVWGVTRSRETLCISPIYWHPRPVPARIGMLFSVTPKRQSDGRIMFSYKQSSMALAQGQTLTGSEMGDTGSSGWSWGDAGATTLLCSMDEERYTRRAGVPGKFQTDGIMHVILIKNAPI